MDALSSMFEVVGSVNWTVIFQLVLLGAIAIAGPVVIFLLAARGGDL